MHRYGDPQDREDRIAGTSPNRDGYDIIIERRCLELDRRLDACIVEQRRALTIADPPVCRWCQR